MLHGMLHVYFMFQASWHASCFVFDDSYFMFHVMPHGMLLRVMFYGMLDASCHVSIMSYPIKSLTSADSIGMSLQERSMKADVDQGNLILASYHVSLTS